VEQIFEAVLQGPEEVARVLRTAPDSHALFPNFNLATDVHAVDDRIRPFLDLQHR